MASQGSGSDGAPLSTGSMLSSYSSTSSSSRDNDMAIKLQKTTSLTVQVLQEITNNFSEKLQIGQGAYGKVYRAKLDNGEEIAVKVLHNNMPDIDDVQFQREFENLMRLEHNNIVSLVGYCYETQRQPMQHMGRTIFAERTYRALCFEYMENGSLEKHLSDACDGFDWHTRYKIIKGTWNGLMHLHEGFDVPIYHLDLKPDNILLDNNMLPKLADFGLSKLFSGEQTMRTQSPMGTIGYLPMEFLRGQIVSNKFDIFSLGVVMVKIIAGRGGYGRSAEMPRQEFLDLVQEKWRERMMETCRASWTLEAYCKQVNICTQIALSCMDMDRHKRPNIADIIDQLNGTEAVIHKALTATAHLVKLEALTSSEAVPYDERCNDYPILVQVTVPPWRHAEAEEMPRTGVDLVLVVHNHWSEERVPAVAVVIDKLGPNDRLSVVSSGTCWMELTFMTNEGREFAKLMFGRKILLYMGDSMVVDLSICIDNASKILNGRPAEEADSRAGFIMVLVASAIKDDDTPDISPQFPVHSLGLTYYDAQVQKYVADKTAGTYSFIEGRSMPEIKEGLELFIGGITKVAATSIRITLTAHEGVAISSIESGAYSSRVVSEGRSGEIDINDIYAGEKKNFIVKLKLAEGMAKLLTVGGQYRSLSASKQQLLLPDTDVFVLRPRSGLFEKLRPRLGWSLEKPAMHPEVAAELVRVQLVKGISAMLEADNDHTIRDDTDALWEQIKLSEEGQRAPEETLAGIAEIQKEILRYGKEKESYLQPHRRQRQSYGKEKQPHRTNLPYILSWLSCHQWQRATTKGSRSDSGAFMV